MYNVQISTFNSSIQLLIINIKKFSTKHLSQPKMQEVDLNSENRNIQNIIPTLNEKNRPLGERSPNKLTKETNLLLGKGQVEGKSL